MRSITAIFLAFLYIMVSVTPVFAQESVSTQASPPEIRGEGAYLIDVLSGRALFMKNPNKQLAPASTTKIMTGLLAIEHGNLKDIVTVSSTMLNNKLVYGTQIYLEPGETMKFEDLLYATLLNSANDAAVALAEHVGKDLPRFVEMMNQRARDLGATQTNFVNPSGLTESGHVTTAHDLALIASFAYQNPVFAQYVRTKTQPISRSKEDVPILMVNQNKLLWRDSAINGIKLGYTSAAQNCLVASVSKDGRQLVGVILKSPGSEIYTDMQKMFDYGLTQFNSTIFKPKGAVIASIMVNNEPVDLILDRPIYIAQKLNEPQTALKLRVSPLSTSNLDSVKEGQVVAQVEVLDGETRLNTVPLKSSREVKPETIASLLGSSHLAWMIGSIIGGFALIMIIKRNNARDWNRQARRLRRRNHRRYN